MEKNGIVLGNPEKLNRALFGAVAKGGELDSTGVGEKAPFEAVVAAYDRLAGLITKNGAKVKTGCFWDFKNGKAIENPEIILLVRGVDGVNYEVKDGDEMPLAVKAAQQAAIEDAGTAPEKPAKAKKGKKSVEDEE